MLKLFRKIRLNLIEEGRVRNYLAYAFGEILLVVIGILIALQVNNWNEERKNRQAEQAALIELKDEFDRSYQDFVRVVDGKKSAEAELRAYLELLSDKSKAIEQKASVARPVGLGQESWDPATSVLSSLLSTGQIGNLKNDSLKYLLNGWHQIVQDYEEVETNHLDKLNNIKNFEDSRLPSRITGDGSHKSLESLAVSVAYLNRSEGEMQAFREQVVEDMLYQNLLIGCVNSLNVQLVHASTVKKDLDSIRRLLEEEIERR